MDRPRGRHRALEHGAGTLVAERHRRLHNGDRECPALLGVLRPRAVMMNRRELLARLAALGMVGLPTTATGQTRRLNILWRNAWAVVNIGDIGHVPGALALLRHYIPEAGVTLWAQQDL